MGNYMDKMGATNRLPDFRKRMGDHTAYAVSTGRMALRVWGGNSTPYLYFRTGQRALPDSGCVDRCATPTLGRVHHWRNSRRIWALSCPFVSPMNERVQKRP